MYIPFYTAGFLKKYKVSQPMVPTKPFLYNKNIMCVLVLQVAIKCFVVLIKPSHRRQLYEMLGKKSKHTICLVHCNNKNAKTFPLTLYMGYCVL